MSSDAVELTAAQAWLVADLVGAGEYPWPLAITQPFGNPLVAGKIIDGLRQELAGLGVLDSDGNVDQRVAAWVRAVCAARRRGETGSFEARTVRAGSAAPTGRADQLRTVVVCRDDSTVVAMRAGALVTLTNLGPAHPRTLASVLTAGLPGAEPATFRQFSLPTADGALADERLRAGAPAQRVLAGLDLPDEARDTLAAMLAGPRSFVEISSVSPDRAAHPETARLGTAADIGIGVLDTVAGRVLVAPSKAPDGQWLSTFSPGTTAAIAAALAALAEDVFAEAM
ncbi:MAG: ESX secretion-associated protein EspG [Segniliparus sp.]|uniref:ESX secretion-associated protein EspG n=1 Tax=Segniliparus sp. TaxID=2804064 RepID=UPI003F2F6DB3